MKTLALILAFAVAGTMADGLHSHGRQGRARPVSGRRQQQQRRGRQEELPGYAGEESLGDAPLTNYGNGLNDPAAGGDSNLAMLEKSIPGVPGQDYPIFAEVPESAFSCDGQVDGGYYADAEAQCQVFHICTANGQGGLAKYSFLCPNGTIFNQNYFICDWWFNFDCSEAESLYALNEKIAAEREAAGPGANDAPISSYGAGAPAPRQGSVPPPPPAPVSAEADYEEEQSAPAGAYGAPAGAYGAPVGAYGAPAADAGAEEENLDNYEPDRQGRAFRGGRQGRRQNIRPQGRRGRQQFRG